MPANPSRSTTPPPAPAQTQPAPDEVPIPRMSPSLGRFAPAFVRVQASLQPVIKSHENPAFKGSTYADLAAILSEALPILSANGFGLMQFPSTENGQLALMSMLIHESGEFVSATMPLLLQKADPQGEGSAISYGRRYAACAILGIRTADDDGNEASVRTPPPARRPEREREPKVAPPKTEGWPSAEHEAEAHKDIAHRLGQLPEDHPVRIAGRVMREKHGWPVVLERLAELRDLLDEAERAPLPAQSDEKAPSPSETTNAPDAPSLPLPEPEKPKAKRGTGGPLVKCAWCGTDIKDEAVVPVVFHDQSRFMHGRCKAEVDEETKGNGGVQPPF